MPFPHFHTPWARLLGVLLFSHPSAKRSIVFNNFKGEGYIKRAFAAQGTTPRVRTDWPVVYWRAFLHSRSKTVHYGGWCLYKHNKIVLKKTPSCNTTISHAAMTIKAPVHHLPNSEHTRSRGKRDRALPARITTAGKRLFSNNDDKTRPKAAFRVGAWWCG